MPALFESTEMNGMTLKNRFVRSATYEGMAEPDGQVTDELLDPPRPWKYSTKTISVRNGFATEVRYSADIDQ